MYKRQEEPFEASMAMKAVLRTLELQGKPVVAAINGHALGLSLIHISEPTRPY